MNNNEPLIQKVMQLKQEINRLLANRQLRDMSEITRLIVELETLLQKLDNTDYKGSDNIIHN